MWLRTKSAAQYAAISIRQLDRWVSKGLTCYKIEDSKLFHPYDIDDFIRSHKPIHKKRKNSQKRTSKNIANQIINHLN